MSDSRHVVPPVEKLLEEATRFLSDLRDASGSLESMLSLVGDAQVGKYGSLNLWIVSVLERDINDIISAQTVLDLGLEALEPVDLV